MDYLQNLVPQLNVVEWGIVGVILFLAAGSKPSKALAAKAWSLVSSVKLPKLTTPEPSPVVHLDDTALIVHQLRLLICDDPPRVRDGVNKHLDEIEQLLNSTEIITNE